MKTSEICPLTAEALAKLLNNRNSLDKLEDGNERRKTPRWPFPGTAELWIPDENGIERHALATSLDLSVHGVGLMCDEPLTPGLELAIAIHEPELSLHGRGLVRHCTEVNGEYLIGMEFVEPS